MSIFKCKMCGGDLEISEGMSVAECQYCGTKQTLPRLDNDKKEMLFDRANHFRRNNEFDKAIGIYEQILNEDNTDSEAYWSLVLCNYGIEYVQDPTTHKRVPTVNRAQFTSVFDDENYKSALHYADGYQKEIYEQEAKAINEIQKGILAISQQEEPFDVFICYKETDESGRRTQDSVLANDLYHQLTQEGFKVFFSRITLEDKLGTAYEPYIFAALNSAKVMVVLGTKPEYFNAVWVKNEWSRYLALIKNGANKMLIPAYKDMDPYDLPEEFAHIQSQDMSKLGFMQDLIRGIKKIASVDEFKVAVKETVTQENNNSSETLLKRASLFIVDENWSSANEYCEKVLDIDPENAEAYLYKLMIDLHIKKESDIAGCVGTLAKNNNYNKIILFGNDELKARMIEYDNSCKYNYAESVFHDHNYESAKLLFEKLHGYKDSENRIADCIQKLEDKKIQEEQLKTQIDKFEKEDALLQKKVKINKMGSVFQILATLFGILSLSFVITGMMFCCLDGISIYGALVVVIGVIFLIFFIISVMKLKSFKKDISVIENTIKAYSTMVNEYNSKIEKIINDFPVISMHTQNSNRNSENVSSTSANNGSHPSFCMAINQCYFIDGRGTFITGYIKLGEIFVNDTLSINGAIYQVLAIESFRKTVSSANAGMNVGLLISKSSINFAKGTIVKGVHNNVVDSCFTVKLIDPGTNKVETIKIIREFTGLGRSLAKRMSEVVPSVITTVTSADTANTIKARLESAGARVEIE